MQRINGKMMDIFSLFMSSGSRLSAMTKTYTDVDMVVELLQEKEHDLELAARIGQSLLEENQQQRRVNEARRRANQQSARTGLIRCEERSVG